MLEQFKSDDLINNKWNRPYIFDPEHEENILKECRNLVIQYTYKLSPMPKYDKLYYITKISQLSTNETNCINLLHRMLNTITEKEYENLNNSVTVRFNKVLGGVCNMRTIIPNKASNSYWNVFKDPLRANPINTSNAIKNTDRILNSFVTKKSEDKKSINSYIGMVTNVNVSEIITYISKLYVNKSSLINQPDWAPVFDNPVYRNYSRLMIQDQHYELYASNLGKPNVSSCIIV